MKEKFLMFFNVIVSFAAFLLCFGKTCYEYGLNAGHADGLWALVLFALVYFVLFVATLVIFHRECNSAKPYIVMAVVGVVLIALAWGSFLIAESGAPAANVELGFSIALTVLSVCMSVLYVVAACQFRNRKEKDATSSDVK